MYCIIGKKSDSNASTVLLILCCAFLIMFSLIATLPHFAEQNSSHPDSGGGRVARKGLPTDCSVVDAPGLGPEPGSKLGAVVVDAAGVAIFGDGERFHDVELATTDTGAFPKGVLTDGSVVDTLCLGPDPGK